METDTKDWHLEMERVMAKLNAKQSKKNHRIYLSGYLECLRDTSQISDNVFEELAPIYGQ